MLVHAELHAIPQLLLFHMPLCGSLCDELIQELQLAVPVALGYTVTHRDVLNDLVHQVNP